MSILVRKLLPDEVLDHIVSEGMVRSVFVTLVGLISSHDTVVVFGRYWM